jgi:hypothetical protein
MTVRFVALVGMMLAAQAATPQKATAPDPLFGAHHFTCSFSLYAARVLKDGAAQVVSGAKDTAFDIDSIDTKKNRARIVGTTGSGPASLLVTGVSVNVIEITAGGNLNVTTIFAGGGPEGKYLAVHSRHLGGPNSDLTPSQNYGTCAIAK